LYQWKNHELGMSGRTAIIRRQDRNNGEKGIRILMERAFPTALLYPVREGKSGRGLPQSKTLARRATTRFGMAAYPNFTGWPVLIDS
jgi:hypothetical protein